MPLGGIYVEDGRAHLTLAEDELIVAAHLPPDSPPSAYARCGCAARSTIRWQEWRWRLR